MTAPALTVEQVEHERESLKNGYGVDHRKFDAICDLALAALSERDGEVAWIEGVPPHPYDKEWFIALTTYGDKVVLQALPKEYTYDYKTADDTYILASKIKCWMQFPDSEFIPFTRPQAGQEVVTKEKLLEWHSFWSHYSSINEPAQDDIADEKVAHLNEILTAAQGGSHV